MAGTAAERETALAELGWTALPTARELKRHMLRCIEYEYAEHLHLHGFMPGEWCDECRCICAGGAGAVAQAMGTAYEHDGGDNGAAMTADNVLGKADEERQTPTPASARCFVERVPYSSTNRPATLGRAHEGSPPSRLAAPSAATTIDGALVAIDEAPYMSAGPGLGGRACGAL